MFLDSELLLLFIMKRNWVSASSYLIFLNDIEFVSTLVQVGHKFERLLKGSRSKSKFCNGFVSHKKDHPIKDCPNLWLLSNKDVLNLQSYLHGPDRVVARPYIEGMLMLKPQNIFARKRKDEISGLVDLDECEGC